MINIKKEHLYISLLFPGFIGLLWFEKPLKALLNHYCTNELQNGFIAGIIVRFFILLLLIGIIRYFKFENFNGIGKERQVGNLHALILPCTIASMGIMSNWDNYVNADITLFLLFILSALMVGFAEEFAFRGIIFPLFIRSFSEKRSSLTLGVIATAFLFGAIHFVNLFSQPGNIIGVTQQVFFALSIGVFFGGLLLRTGSLMVVSMFHGLVNFAFSGGELGQAVQKEVIGKPEEGINWNSLIPTTILFTFILFGGLYMIRKVKKEDVLEKLGF
ncbi:MAG: hypothetical protein EPGJADBJ_04927 [Saprospiraceae bacterium]|nr:hypothetical protein [Saprospiraceae bacterium]